MSYYSREEGKMEQVKRWRRHRLARPWLKLLCALPEDLRRGIYTLHLQTRMALDWESVIAHCEEQHVYLHPWGMSLSFPPPPPHEKASYFLPGIKCYLLAPAKLYWQGARVCAIDTSVLTLPLGCVAEDQQIHLLLGEQEDIFFFCGQTLKTIY